MATKATTTTSSTPVLSLSDTQTVDTNPEARAQLDEALNSFASRPTIQGTVSGAINTAVTGEVIDSEELTPPEVESEDVATQEETEVEEETSEPSGFDQEFSKRFGVQPEEAIETINTLLAFRDEMALMRQWAVSPSEYDNRMTQVKEFYQTLPEDKQPEFNTPEGAKAIWDHLSKNNTKSKSSTATKAGGSKKPANAPSKPFIKKSDILRMPPDEYSKRLPEINAAWREGRVLESQ